MQEMVIVWLIMTGLLVSKLANSTLPLWISLLAVGAFMFNKKGAVQ